MKRYLLILLTLLVVSGCYYDKEAVLYPDSVNCTAPANPSFAVDIKPILDSRCNSCHSGAYASAGIRLDTYNEVVKYVNSGSLMGSINHTGGYSPMPKNGGKLPSCKIKALQNWITSGITNN